MGRSRKQKDRMNRVKRVRNAAKILVMLKKTLGLIDKDGNEIIKKVTSITEVKQPTTFKEVSKNFDSLRLCNYLLLLLFCGAPFFLLTLRKFSF